MINNDNKEYLLKEFNIDINKYSIDELNIILDKIIIALNDSIKNKVDDLVLLKNEIENRI